MSPPENDQQALPARTCYDLAVHISQSRELSQPLCSSSSRFRGSASVLERLPVELISDIFLKAVKDIEGDLLFLPTVVASLSRRCRAVACATKQLWTTITLASEADDFALDRLWLKRSGTASLDIILDLRSGDCCWEDLSTECIYSPTSIERRMEILHPHFTRCKTLRVYTDTWAPIGLVLTHLKDVPAAPRLTTLDLVRTSADASYRDMDKIYMSELLWLLSSLIPFGGNVPMLKELVLAGVHTGWLHCRPLMYGLKHLNLSNHPQPLRPSIEAFRDILEACKDTLRSILISSSGPAIPDDQMPNSPSSLSTRTTNLQGSSLAQPIVLHTVTSLHIGYKHELDALSTLAQFSAPNTRRLLVEDSSCALFRGREHVDGGCTLHSVAQSLQRPENRGTQGATSVESVLLHNVHANVEDFVDFFRSLPKIEEVLLDSMQPSVVEALLIILSECLRSSPSPRNGSCIQPCPYLRSILLRGMTVEVKTDGWLEELRRLAHEANVSVSVERPPPPDDISGSESSSDDEDLDSSESSSDSEDLDGWLSESEEANSGGLAYDVFEAEYEDARLGSGTSMHGRVEVWIKSRWQPGARGGVDDFI